MSKLAQTLAGFWYRIQGTLFTELEEELGPMTKKQQQLIEILELCRIEEYIPHIGGCEGRPQKCRRALARSFIAKSVYNMPTTRMLWERLQTDINLRRICGWESKRQIPSESTFSRAMNEFAESNIPQRAHEALITKSYHGCDEIVGHNSRDSTPIEARERPIKKEAKETCSSPRRRGRPKRGEEKVVKEDRRIERQKEMSLNEMLRDLPKPCDIGMKMNSKGHFETWIGYKLHWDVSDDGVPLSAILTSASVHDSQVAIPLTVMTAQRVVNLYDLMDSAYDVPEIREYSRSLGHVSIIDKNPRRDTKLALEIENEEKARKNLMMPTADEVRYRARSSVERANSRLKDEFGGRMVRVQGTAKVMCHLMFGVLALAADQLMKIVM